MGELPPLVIFGCGYVGTRLAKAALAQGRVVKVCARGVARLQPLGELGAQVVWLDAAKSKQFGPALTSCRGATVVYSIPPPAGLPAGEAVRRAAKAALEQGASCFIYLGSSGVYGNIADPEWVDEETPVAHDDGAMAPRLHDETAVQIAAGAGLRTAILRLGGIYGPGRGVRVRLRKGNYELIDGGHHFISRIHVDDLVAVIFAVEARAPSNALYIVADDRPTPQREVALWICQRLGLPEPLSVPAFASGRPRATQRGRRLSNAKLKRELSFEFRYPTYVEGEQAIEAEETLVSG